jgi:transcriptional regulator with XRE-family HTH domain
MITAQQVRMARAALKWSVAELASRAGVTAKTVLRYENGRNTTTETLMKIKGAFEAVGVTWIPENGGAATVRPPRQLPDEAKAQDKVDA